MIFYGKNGGNPINFQRLVGLINSLNTFTLMKSLKFIFDAYIQSSIHVSLAVVSLLAVTSFQFEIRFTETLYFLTFVATLVGYNTIKYGWRKTTLYRMVPNRFPVLTITASVFLLLGFWTLPWKQQMVFLLTGLLVLFYVYPIQRGSINLRNQQKIKIYWVAFVWSLFTVLFPVVNAKMDSFLVIAVGVHRFVFVLCATIPFEIRDLATDAPSLRTLPQRFGVLSTKWIGVVLGASSCFFALWMRWESIWISLSIHLLLVVSIVNARTKQGPYYASFWVESIPIIWLLVQVEIS